MKDDYNYFKYLKKRLIDLLSSKIDFSDFKT